MFKTKRWFESTKLLSSRQHVRSISRRINIFLVLKKIQLGWQTFMILFYFYINQNGVVSF